MFQKLQKFYDHETMCVFLINMTACQM